MKTKMLRFLYHLFLKYNYPFRKWTRSLDPEMALIPELAKNRRRAVDIGANVGVYTRFLSRFFERVEAFEPLYQASGYIQKDRSNVNLHNIGLSDKKERIEFHIPYKMGVARYGNSSLEQSIFNKFEAVKKVEISTNTLDHYNFKEVDFIKIDVEGHELQVLQGAEKTIRENKPLILIEIEERHLADPVTIDDIFNVITGYNYQGYFLSAKGLVSCEHFDVQKHQRKFVNRDNNIWLSNKDKARLYVNNFFFIPGGSV